MRYAVIGAAVKQVKDAGGTDIKEARSTGIIFATLTESQAAYLGSLGFIVNKVGKVKAPVMPPRPVAAEPRYSPEELVWAAGFEELRSISEPPLYGSGFTLAIIDSGIRETHEQIKGRVIYRKNYTSSPMGDTFNHGTGVCSIALAVAPQCNILNLKVLGDEGSGTEEGVVLAIDDCISLQDTQPDIAPSVINLSLGTPDDGNPNNIIRVACRAAIERRIWVIAAAGNEGKPLSIMSPGCEKYVGCVGSCSYEPFEVSDFQSRGPTKEGLIKPDCLLFGEDIVVASSVSDTATIAKSGTSFSTPFTAAMGLLYFEGMYRVVLTARPLPERPGYPPAIEGDRIPSIQDTLDVYMPWLCVKPQGVALEKDNEYGCGLPLGSLVFKALTQAVAPGVDITALLTGMTTVVGVGMVGMMMVPMIKAFK